MARLLLIALAGVLMLNLVRLGSFVALMLVVACGGSDSDRNGVTEGVNPGEAGIGSGIDPNTPFADLTSEDAQKICGAWDAFARERITPEHRLRMACADAAGPVASIRNESCEVALARCESQTQDAAAFCDGTNPQACIEAARDAFGGLLQEIYLQAHTNMFLCNEETRADFLYGDEDGIPVFRKLRDDYGCVVPWGPIETCFRDMVLDYASTEPMCGQPDDNEQEECLANVVRITPGCETVPLDN